MPRRIGLTAAIAATVVAMSACSGEDTPPLSPAPAGSSTLRLPVTASPTTSRPAPVERQVQALAFADATHGLAMERRCRGRDCRQLTFTTADGGRSWRAVSSWSPPGRGFGIRLVMADPGDAFALVPTHNIGTALFASHDGGRSWHRVAVPGHVTTLTATRRLVWAAASDCPRRPRPSHPRCRSRLFAATPMSDRFSAVGRPPTRGRPISALTAYGDVVVLTAGIVEGGDTVLLRSADGGHHWTRMTKPGRRAFDIGVGAAPDGTVWALCFSEPGAGQQLKQLFVSDDGGTTWSRRPDPSSSGYSTEIEPQSADVAWLVGDGRADVLRTDDGGRTWRDPLRGRVGESAGGAGYGFAAVDAVHAWVSMQPLRGPDARIRVLRTADGGAHWTAAVLPR